MSLPDPLLPADVDLRDFGFMPIDIMRLFDSEFHANASDAEWRAGVTLWLKSYHQVPAASLPSDDIALARLAELGRDVKTWRKIKAGALRGWIECSDGRLYHAVVAEKAVQGWNAKRQHSWKRECDRLRKENKAREKDGSAPLSIPGKPAELLWNSVSRRCEFQRNEPGFPTESPAVSDGIPLENALKGQGEGQGELSTSLRSVDCSVLADGMAPAVDPPETPPEPWQHPAEVAPSGTGKAPRPTKPSVEHDRALFERAEEVFGPKTGGLTTRLKQHYGGNIAMTRAAVETASTKHRPREFAGKILANAASERTSQLLYDPSL